MNYTPQWMTTAHGAPYWGVETTWRLARGLLVKQRSSDQLYCAFDGQCGTKMDLQANEMSRFSVSAQEGAFHGFRISLMHGWVILEMTKSPLRSRVCNKPAEVPDWLQRERVEWSSSTNCEFRSWRSSSQGKTGGMGEVLFSWYCSCYITTVWCGNRE